jgi:steroid 5-alpha reductase family enzyme
VNLLAALALNLALLVATMFVLWLISIRIRDVSFIDAFWAYGMAIMASASFMQSEDPGSLAYVIWALTALWGIRLGTHLFLRWRKEGVDPRYRKILGHAMEKQGMGFAKAALLKAWALQIPLLFIVCLPAQLGILLAGTADVGPLAIVGSLIALTGIAFETIGDMQLKAFRTNPANKGKVLDRGLWKYTRHPNYFGDFCAWWGIWLVAVPTGWPVWIAVIGPLFLSFTLMKWSGAPLLEKSLKKNRPAYADYIERTSGFFPRPPRKNTSG